MDRIKEPWQTAWVATHRHSKGGLYRVITAAILEADVKTMMTVYDDEGGRVWVRPSSDFHDGRFVPIEAANYDNAPTDPHHGGKIWGDQS
jgi:hypothetical protein